MAHPAARRRGEIVLPAALVIVGAVFVLREIGALTGVPVAPVLLIVLGVAVLTGGLSAQGSGADETSESLVLPLEGATSARVALHYGAGNPAVAGGASEGLAYEGSFVGGARAEVTRTGERLDIDAGAAEVTVQVPQGVAAAIRTRSALASVDVDQSRFPRSSGGYRSPDYDTANHRADIDIEGGVASFTVR